MEAVFPAVQVRLRPKPHCVGEGEDHAVRSALQVHHPDAVILWRDEAGSRLGALLYPTTGRSRANRPKSSEAVKGRSLLPLLADERRTVRERLYLAYGSSQRAMKTERHKLIEFVVEGRRVGTRFFDLLCTTLAQHLLFPRRGCARVVRGVRGAPAP